MVTINEKFPDKTGHSIRVNNKLVEICNGTGIPFTTIVENCLVHFSCLDDEQKVRFLLDNDPDKVAEDKLKAPSFNFADKAVSLAKENIGNKSVGKAVLLFMGLALLVAFVFPAFRSDKVE